MSVEDVRNSAMEAEGKKITEERQLARDAQRERQRFGGTEDPAPWSMLSLNDIERIRKERKHEHLLEHDAEYRQRVIQLEEEVKEAERRISHAALQAQLDMPPPTPLEILEHDHQAEVKRFLAANGVAAPAELKGTAALHFELHVVNPYLQQKKEMEAAESRPVE